MVPIPVGVTHMTTISPASVDQRPASSAMLWPAPRVVNVAVARPDTTPGTVPGPAIEWQPRSRADRRL